MPAKTIAGTHKLFLFGAFRAELEKAPISLSARKVQSLLAYLVLYPEEHSREKIAALFWGDSTDTRARDSLRTALKTLRQQLGDNLLLADRESVQINPAFPLWVDTREFEKQLTSVPHSAIALYRGDLLAGLYDDWLLLERERLRDLYLNTLLRLAQEARTRGEYTQAIEWAKKVLALDAANERAHQHLMFCHLALGDRSAALQQYETCAHAMQMELAIDPSPETTALYHWIQQAAAGRATLAAQITNLPIPLSSFVGRKTELAELKARIPASRLLTLTGAGGSGKTRLAIQAATDMIDQFHDGVWWVDLSPLMADTLVIQTVAQVLGVREIPNEALAATLTGFLRDRQVLLILDNCEHLITACAQLADVLLTHCLNLRILGTSREALGITGEIVYQVPTLSLPALQRLTLTDLLMEFEGIRLFVDRARAVQSDFRLTEQNAASVLQICQRLDGIPLAIELAAARTQFMSTGEIERRLDDRLSLLTLGSRTALPRQQTLRAATDWSYDLLTEPERILFRRLPVFVGGFTLEAAGAVCAGETNARNEILNLLAQLAAKSLVVSETEEGRLTRYHLLETIRLYADEKMLEAESSAQLHDLHLDFFLKFAEEAESHLLGTEAPVWLERIQDDWDNFRLAIRWSLKRDRGGKGLRIASALAFFVYARGSLSEFYQILLELLKAQSTASRTAALGKGFYAAAAVAVELGKVADARLHYAESIAILREAGQEARSLLATVLGYFAHALLWSEPRAAARSAEEAVRLCRESGNRDGLAVALNRWAEARYWLNDSVSARALLQESARIAQEIGNQFTYLVAIGNLGVMEFFDGDLDAARRDLDAFNSPWLKSFTSGPAVANELLAAIARLEGQPAAAEKLLDEAIRILHQVGDKHYTTIAHVFLGRLELDQGGWQAAERNFHEAFSLAREAEAWLIVAWSLESFAYLSVGLNWAYRAVKFLGAADAWRERLGTPLRPVERKDYEACAAAAHAQLDTESFNAAWAKGRAMSLDQARDLAFERKQAAD